MFRAMDISFAHKRVNICNQVFCVSKQMRMLRVCERIHER